MPELPEVETVVRTLEKRIKNRRIEKVEVIYEPIITGSVTSFKRKLKGQHFRKFSRRGKFLLFYMDDVLFVSHLRMEGKYYIQDKDEPRDKHMHIIFHLDDGKELRYRDTRKFGRMEICPLDTDIDSFHDLGLEPWDDRLDAQYVLDVCKKRSIPIKTLLLDQHFIAGIGNIYADEILFASKIEPTRSSNTITKKEAELIIKSTRKILEEAIKAGGTTIRSYTSSLGVSGKFQLSCMVHTKKICQKCKSNIIVKYIGGRSTYYCPKCQK